MAEIARRASEQERLSHDMGMHTEQLRGRTPAALLRCRSDRGTHGFSLPDASDVDFNKRAEIDAANMRGQADQSATCAT